MPRSLTQMETAFLADKGIGSRWIYEQAPRQGLDDAIHEMRRQDKYILHGFSRCECGVALRSRKGDCLKCHRMQCDLVKKDTQPGYVYILYSWDAGLTRLTHLIKIGCTGYTPDNRADNLNEKGYAGARDWSVFDYVKVSRRGLLENQLKSALHYAYVKIPYTSYGSSTYSRETYDCDVVVAQSVMKRLQRDYLIRHNNNVPI